MAVLPASVLLELSSILQSYCPVNLSPTGGCFVSLRPTGGCLISLSPTGGCPISLSPSGVVLLPSVLLEAVLPALVLPV